MPGLRWCYAITQPGSLPVLRRGRLANTPLQGLLIHFSSYPYAANVPRPPIRMKTPFPELSYRYTQCVYNDAVQRLAQAQQYPD